MQLLELIQRRSQKPLGDLKSHQLLLLIRDWAHGDDDIGKHCSFQDFSGSFVFCVVTWWWFPGISFKKFNPHKIGGTYPVWLISFGWLATRKTRFWVLVFVWQKRAVSATAALSCYTSKRVEVSKQRPIDHRSTGPKYPKILNLWVQHLQVHSSLCLGILNNKKHNKKQERGGTLDQVPVFFFVFVCSIFFNVWIGWSFF